jgi:glutathione S-transferase
MAASRCCKWATRSLSARKQRGLLVSGFGSALIPTDRFAQADMLRWMFFEQYNHEPNVATLRFWLGKWARRPFRSAARRSPPSARRRGRAGLMDEHLARHDWFVGNGVTLADIALYAYTHVARGGFGLATIPMCRPGWRGWPPAALCADGLKHARNRLPKPRFAPMRAGQAAP